MAKKDKSFFGKIMGGNITDEEGVPVMVPQPQVVEEEVAEIEVEELVDEPYDEAQEPSMAVSEPVRAGKDKENEEWLSDYEGQLNIDMYQTKDNVIIKSTIAGVRPEDIDITVANDMVSIKGARRKEENISQEDYFYQECYWGNFSRSVIVPVDIDSESIEADLKDGILTVVIPKAAKAKTKKVKVKGL
jgi:HSP20 family protein